MWSRMNKHNSGLKVAMCGPQFRQSVITDRQEVCHLEKMSKYYPTQFRIPAAIE